MFWLVYVWMMKMRRVDEDESEGDVVPNLTLVGCFLTASAINFNSMKSTLANLCAIPLLVLRLQIRVRRDSL